MSIRNLEKLFRPKSVAVFGATDRPGRIGGLVIRNLLAAGYEGALRAVNPKYREVAGMKACASVAELDLVPDLAVIATPPPTVPAIVRELGARGTKAAVVLTAGLGAAKDKDGKTLTQAMLEAARPHCLRILGPNCVGLLVPPLKLNASFAHTGAAAGRLAFVSQSGALTTALLDWAQSAGVGFSHFISLGDAADVDFGDAIDWLALDPGTGAILLYIEAIREARKFMSAARAASRGKPVIAVKAGRLPEGAKAAASHTGALAGADDVYEAALARAGILRVSTTAELFDAAGTLARLERFAGERLAIMTNGGGPGVMAADALAGGGGKLAPLSGATVERLNALLPPTWSHANPVDIIGDAPVERYVGALKLLLADPQVDALLFLHAPTAVVQSADIAAGCVPVIRQSGRSVLACWVGGDGLAAARRTFAAAGIPVYATPENAVQAFLHLVRFRRNQELLTQTPPSIAEAFEPRADEARALVRGALARGAQMLTEPEAKAVLAAYGIPVVETRIAPDAARAAAAAKELGFPVALKILSRDISHKSDVGGVALNLEDAAAVEREVQAMERRARELRPGAALEGFTVQRMVRRGGAHELIVGASSDAVFGPVILFGQGGVAVEAIGDRAVALPPLSMVLARDLVRRTRVARLLAGYRGRPAADLDAVCGTLIKVAQLLADVPEIAELDINPLLADEAGVIALDARIRAASAAAPGTLRFAIELYPKELEERIELDGKRILVRPIRPEDEPAHREFLARTDPQDLRTRFLHTMRGFEHPQLAGLTQIDYSRHMAFVALELDGAREGQTLGVVRAVCDPDNERAEFAILVRSDFKGRGLGRALLEKMIRHLRARGVAELWGDVLAENAAMLQLADALGFRRLDAEAGVVRITLPLGAPARDQAGRRVQEEHA